MDPRQSYVIERVFDPTTGAFIEKRVPTDMTSRAGNVSATGGADTVLSITLEPGKTLLLGVLIVSGPDAAVYEITDGTTTYLSMRTTEKEIISNPFEAPIVAIKNTGTANMTINVNVTGTAGNTYRVSIGYVKI